MPFETAQIPTILFSTGWTNHQIIMNRCKSDDERLFYILFAQKEHLQNKQLERAIKTDSMASILRAKDIQSEALHTTYAKSPAPFRLRTPKSRLPALCFTQNPDSTFPPNIFTLRPYAPPPGRSSYNIAAWIALMCCPCRYVLTPACCLWARSSLTFKCRMMGWG